MHIALHACTLAVDCNNLQVIHSWAITFTPVVQCTYVATVPGL